jgi:hypothetical protein
MNKRSCLAFTVFLGCAPLVHAQPAQMPRADVPPEPLAILGAPTATLGQPIPTMPDAGEAPTMLPDGIPAQLPPMLPGMPILRLAIPLATQDSPSPTQPMPKGNGSANLLPVVTVPAAPPAVRFDAAAPVSSRMWFQADYLMWWVKSGPTGGPLATIGDPTVAVPGALDMPNTRVVLGNTPLNYGMSSGVRVSAGIPVGALSLEGNYFVLEQRANNFGLAADSTGLPVIARPVINAQTGMQNSYVDSFPPFLTGTFLMESRTWLEGYEVNLAANVAERGAMRFSVLGGLRILDLRETMSLSDNLFPAAAGFLTFNGAPVGVPSQLVDIDRFRVGNQFYGGQLGGRLGWQGSTFTINAIAKVALGATQEVVRIDGSTTVFAPGASPMSAPGGILAQPSNIGQHFRSTFAVVPEVGLEIGYQITPRLRATLGYTLLYWSAVARPGNQIDRTVNPAQVPGDFMFGMGGGPARPALVTIRESDFWAQGINVGLVFGF